MLYKEVIYLNERDIKSIIAKAFNTEEYNIDILIENYEYGTSVQVRVER